MIILYGSWKPNIGAQIASATWKETIVIEKNNNLSLVVGGAVSVDALEILKRVKNERLDRFETRCRLKTGLVPEPEALIVNNTSIKNLENTNLSHYDLTKDIKRKIENWSPAIFFGYNSINFDEEIIRKTFFKTLFNAYVTQLEGNKRGDICYCYW